MKISFSINHLRVFLRKRWRLVDFDLSKCGAFVNGQRETEKIKIKTDAATTALLPVWCTIIALETIKRPQRKIICRKELPPLLALFFFLSLSLSRCTRGCQAASLYYNRPTHSPKGCRCIFVMCVCVMLNGTHTHTPGFWIVLQRLPSVII